MSDQSLWCGLGASAIREGIERYVDIVVGGEDFVALRRVGEQQAIHADPRLRQTPDDLVGENRLGQMVVLQQEPRAGHRQEDPRPQIEYVLGKLVEGVARAEGDR